MAEKYGFFDAVMVNGTPDRVYSAEDVNEIFKGLLSEGVFRLYANALKVTPSTGLAVHVDTGKAIIKDHWYINTTVKRLEVSQAHATLDRYSSVVLRYTSTTRSIALAIIDGDPASSPVVPTLTQTSTVREIRLANILVSAGATSLSSSDIIDTRSYSSGLVDTPDVSYRRYDCKQTEYSSGQRYFDIPDSYSLTANTHLEVYSNGLICKPSEYTLQVNEVEGNMMVVFNVKRELNCELSFVMMN